MCGTAELQPLVDAPTWEKVKVHIQAAALAYEGGSQADRDLVDSTPQQIGPTVDAITALSPHAQPSESSASKSPESREAIVKMACERLSQLPMDKLEQLSMLQHALGEAMTMTDNKADMQLKTSNRLAEAAASMEKLAKATGNVGKLAEAAASVEKLAETLRMQNDNDRRREGDTALLEAAAEATGEEFSKEDWRKHQVRHSDLTRCDALTGGWWIGSMESLRFVVACAAGGDNQASDTPTPI